MNFTKFLVVATTFSICTSCASIVSKSKYPVTINSSPQDASVKITDRRGDEVFSGKTPSLVRLKSGAGFFANAKYKIVISKPGFQERTIELKATLNGWYFGNVIFGGLIGLLIVDPATGAMYKLNNLDVNETLTPASTTAQATPSLQVYDINNIPAAWKDKLVLIAKN